MYKKIINHHGVIMEFGVRWGPILNLFQSLRGVYEPFNDIERLSDLIHLRVYRGDSIMIEFLRKVILRHGWI